MAKNSPIRPRIRGYRDHRNKDWRSRQECLAVCKWLPAKQTRQNCSWWWSRNLCQQRPRIVCPHPWIRKSCQNWTWGNDKFDNETREQARSCCCRSVQTSCCQGWMVWGICRYSPAANPTGPTSHHGGPKRRPNEAQGSAGKGTAGGPSIGWHQSSLNGQYQNYSRDRHLYWCNSTGLRFSMWGVLHQRHYSGRIMSKTLFAGRCQRPPPSHSATKCWHESSSQAGDKTVI